MPACIRSPFRSRLPRFTLAQDHPIVQRHYREALQKLIRAMTLRPAEILGLSGGRLEVGAPADLIRFDPDEPYVLDPKLLHSRCRNTPFDEARMEGVVKLTLVAGEIAHA